VVKMNKMRAHRTCPVGGGGTRGQRRQGWSDEHVSRIILELNESAWGIELYNAERLGIGLNNAERLGFGMELCTTSTRLSGRRNIRERFENSATVRDGLVLSNRGAWIPRCQAIGIPVGAPAVHSILIPLLKNGVVEIDGGSQLYPLRLASSHLREPATLSASPQASNKELPKHARRHRARQTDETFSPSHRKESKKRKTKKWTESVPHSPTWIL
jgi:hypothetical protein